MTLTHSSLASRIRRKDQRLKRVFRGTPSRYSQATYIGDRAFSLRKIGILFGGIVLVGVLGIGTLKLQSITHLGQVAEIHFIDEATASIGEPEGKINIEFKFIDKDVEFVDFWEPDNISPKHTSLTTAPSTPLPPGGSFLSNTTLQDNQIAVVAAATDTQNAALETLNLPPEIPQHTAIKFQSGDSFYDVALAQGLSEAEILSLLKDREAKRALGRIRVGQSIHFYRDDKGAFSSLEYHPSIEKKLVVQRDDDNGFASSVVKTPLLRNLEVAYGRIDSSLFSTAESIGISHNLVMNLVDIYKWDIDFAQDVQEGDEFAIVYESFTTENGTPVRTGKILAAEFTNRNKASQAILFEDQTTSGYYTADGKSLRKSFMRNPVDIVRITSRFSKGRMHPVLHKIKAHKGVDYGAKVGTPIYATADGVIQHLGTMGGYGRTIVIEHANGYSTLYAHMSKYGNKKRSQRVKQGQIIGYVGASGRVTGPHLHYEVRINGVHTDPLKLKTLGGSKLSGNQLAKLRATAEPLLNQLAQAKKQANVDVASSN